MLQRSIFRASFRRPIIVLSRCLADNPSDNIPPESKVDLEMDKKKASDANVQKIQELLKSMMAEPKISDSEYRQKFATAPESPRGRKQKLDEVEIKMEKIEESITKSATEVAQAIGGDVKQTEAELLSKVLGKINQTSTTLSDLLVGMKVDRSKDGDDKPETRGQQVKRFVEQAKDRPQRSKYLPKRSAPPHRDSSQPQSTFVNVFSGQPLGIFKAHEPNYGTKLDVWENLEKRELALATAQPPANYFEKMILWTEQGKVWKFPINNEQGLEEEQNVDFSEHVFMEAHLEDWCPRKGPVRHFMELVCVGLSKNAFYTAREKKETIMWYKDYFVSKKDILAEVGAWDVEKLDNTNQI